MYYFGETAQLQQQNTTAVTTEIITGLMFWNSF